jgi:hypothetical protein
MLSDDALNNSLKKVHLVSLFSFVPKYVVSSLLLLMSLLLLASQLFNESLLLLASLISTDAGVGATTGVFSIDY